MHLSLNTYFLLFECSGHTGTFEQFFTVTAKCTSSFTCYSIVTLCSCTDKATSPSEEAGPVKTNLTFERSIDFQPFPYISSCV